jgi:hypothetical protein
MGVLVGVGGNQTTVGVGVWEGAGVSDGVGGIGVGGEQAVSAQIANKQMVKGKWANRPVCKNDRLPIRQFTNLLICLFVWFSNFTQSAQFGPALARQMPS